MIKKICFLTMLFLPVFIIPTFAAPNIPRWQREMNERANELQQLQKQNAPGNMDISRPTEFPATIDDLPFSARQQLETESIEPYKDSKAYNEYNWKTAEEWCPDHLNDVGCEMYKAAAETPKNATNQSTNIKKTLPASLTDEEKEAVLAVVDFLEPQSKEEEQFFTDLATDFVPKVFKDNDLMLDNPFVYNFLADYDGSLTKYKDALINLTGIKQDEDLHIDLDWDDALIQISTLLDASLTRRGALVCENNRSYQVGIDTAMWIGTVVAAIFSFGAGGVATAGGRAALGAGLKALAKGTSKVGLKNVSRRIAAKGGENIAKAATGKMAKKTGFKVIGKKGKPLSGGAVASWYSAHSGKDIGKHILKQAGKNLKTKRGLLLVSGAVAGAIYETAGRSGIAKSQVQDAAAKKQKTAGVLYSLVESEPSTEIIGCQDLDYGEGCYAVCGHDAPDDDLNVKVFKPILGRTYCVSETDYTLYDTETKKPLMVSSDDYVKITQKIRAEVADKGAMEDKWKSLTNQKNGRHGCDWNEDDIDMYFGAYIYDPDTFEPSSNMIIEEVIRIDD